MSTDKFRRNIYLNEKNDTKLNELASEADMSRSAFVVMAMKQYEKNQGEEYNVIKEIVTDVLNEKIEPLSVILNKVMLANNEIDRQQKINLELLNHLMYIEQRIDVGGQFSHKNLYGTNQHKVTQVQKAEEIVREEISRLRTIKQDNLM